MRNINKYQRYTTKCVSEGRCPHCGKPCAPYYECAKRRSYKAFMRMFRRMVKTGEIIDAGNGKYIKGIEVSRISTSRGIRPIFYQTKEDDRRTYPRLGKQYIDTTGILIAILKEHSHPLTIDEINVLAEQKVNKIKQNFRHVYARSNDKNT